MALAIEQIARKLNVPPEKLLRESLLAYVAQQERLTEMDVADIRERYGVTTPEELASRIESGAIYSHPAWEDLIEWENLREHLRQLNELRASLN
jgi:hypothetical protein